MLPRTLSDEDFMRLNLKTTHLKGLFYGEFKVTTILFISFLKMVCWQITTIFNIQFNPPRGLTFTDPCSWHFNDSIFLISVSRFYLFLTISWPLILPCSWKFHSKLEESFYFNLSLHPRFNNLLTNDKFARAYKQQFFIFVENFEKQEIKVLLF